MPIILNRTIRMIYICEIDWAHDLVFCFLSNVKDSDANYTLITKSEILKESWHLLFILLFTLKSHKDRADLLKNFRSEILYYNLSFWLFRYVLVIGKGRERNLEYIHIERIMVPCHILNIEINVFQRMCCPIYTYWIVRY